jgi:hypothetical protein
MENKIKLKKMSHKQLRKLCKGVARDLHTVNAAKNEAVRQVEVYKDREKSLKVQFDAEVYYKNKYLQDLNTAEDELYRYRMQCERYEKRIEELELALDGTTTKMPYIGEMPDDLQMGVDGQLREEGNCVGHQPFDEPTNGVIDSEGNHLIPKSADVDAAVEWAKRNGHHQPEGNPEPNKMNNVRIKSADEISAENVERHTEIVCNDIANDKSRLLESDSDFDKEGDYEEWSRE